MSGVRRIKAGTRKTKQKLSSLLNSDEAISDMMQGIKSELLPYLDGIVTKKGNFDLFKESYLDYKDRYASAWQIVDFMARTSSRLHKFPIEQETLGLFTYLGLVESLGNTIIDMIVMLLVANGKDFHIECSYTTPRIRHASSINDLENERVPLTTKLNFLRSNNISCLSSVIDSKLRNKIAHARFIVEEKEIHIDGKPVRKVLYQSYDRLIIALETTDFLLEQLAKSQGVHPKRGK